ncbi:MAG: hypothetical protein HUU50_04385 [Candidatus Brocadiae bacterium]|nr:hypothetical protein [Candidatus Brocadiia bacterium]
MSNNKIGIVFAIVLALAGIALHSLWIALFLSIFYFTACSYRWKILFSHPYLIKTTIKLTLTMILVVWALDTYRGDQWFWACSFLIYWWIAGWVKVDMTEAFIRKKSQDKKAIWIRKCLAFILLLFLFFLMADRSWDAIVFFLAFYWYFGLRRQKLWAAFSLLRSETTKGIKSLFWEMLSFIFVNSAIIGIMKRDVSSLCLALLWFYIDAMADLPAAISAGQQEQQAQPENQELCAVPPVPKAFQEKKAEISFPSAAIKEENALPATHFSLASFLSQNLVSVLLALGVCFVFTGVVVFLRSHWETYKYIVFWGFLGCTLACFTSSYRMLWKNQWVHKIGFTLLLLASVFFPLNFYFAVKVGLLPDHGNRYIVFWLTSFLFAWNAWLLRSTLFTLFTAVLLFCSHFLTLEKFIAPSMFGLFFALNSLVFLLPAYIAQRKSLSSIAFIFQCAANVIYVFAIIECIFWWRTEVFAWVMFFGTTLGVFQILALQNPYFSLFSCANAALSFLLSIAAFSNLSGMPVFWQGILPCAASFIVLGLFPRYSAYLPDKEKNIVPITAFSCVPIVLIVYCFLGGYTTSTFGSGLVAFPVVSMIGYVAVNAIYRHSLCTYTAIAMNGLLLINLYQKSTDISHSTWAVLFLLWGLLLAAATSLPQWQKREWIRNPLYYASHVVVLAVLGFTCVWAREFYQEHFSTLSLVLVFALCFYLYYALWMKRKDMMMAGILLLLILCFIQVQRLEGNLQYLCLIMTALALVLWMAGNSLQVYGNVFIMLSGVSLCMVFAFPLIAFFNSLGYDFWAAPCTLLLGMLFFLIRWKKSQKSINLALVLAYFTSAFFLYFHQKVDFYAWGTLFLFLAILAMVFAIYFAYNSKDTARILAAYSSVVSAICLVQLLVHWNFYYAADTKAGIVFTFLFFFISVALWCHCPRLVTTYIAFLFGYAHYWFWLPKNLYAFEYALYFIPLAIALLLGGNRLRQDSLIRKVSFVMAQSTVFFFLSLPFLMPGVTPGALVSTFVIGLAFVYYFLYIFIYRQTFYCYLSSVLFLACLLAALFASKKFHGNEMAFLLSLGNTFLLIIAYWIRKKSDMAFALPVFRVNLLCNMGLIVSVLVQGKIVNPTLMTMILCSLSFALLAAFPVEKVWLNRKTMSYISVALFAIAYYLMLEKLSLYREWIEFQYLSLSLVSLGMALLLRKTNFFHAFIVVTLFAPILASIKIQSNLSLSILMFFSGIFYGVVAQKIQEKLLAFLSVSFFNIAFFALCFYFAFSVNSFMLLAIVIAQIFLYCAAIAKNKLGDIWKQALVQNAYASHAVFFFLFVGVPHSSLYYPVFLALASALLLFGLYYATQKHLTLASLSFFFSYYGALTSWAVYVWEFYTIPLGLFFLALGYILERSQKESDAHNDCFLLGILLILLPTLAQSCSGWFAHLAPLGISPYNHLYHSLFLSIESLVLLVYGITQKRLIFFFSGLVFLLSDIALLLFAYVNFGTIPQAIWWATLGATLIFSAWILEYRREMLKRFMAYISKQYKDSLLELKTWQ